jgi:hypothetical protein
LAVVDLRRSQKRHAVERADEPGVAGIVDQVKSAGGCAGAYERDVAAYIEMLYGQVEKKTDYIGVAFQ